MKLKTLSNVNLRNKSVLLRIDINSPLVSGKVLDNPRFAESAETIKELLRKRAKVAIVAHQGRKGDPDFFPLRQHAKFLTKYSKTKVKYVDDLFGNNAISSMKSLKPGEAILLSNVRNYKDELDVNNKNNSYKALCSCFDLYVNDAFSVSHREQGSIVLPPKYLPSCIGRSFEKEISALQKFKLDKKKKTVFLLGGSKIEDFLPLFSALKNKNNTILASGVLGNLFLVSQGKNLGYTNKWLKDRGFPHLIAKFRAIYSKHKNQIILPIDFAINIKGKRKEIPLEKFPLNEMIWDVGHKTAKLFISYIKRANSIFMKGPFGFSEIPNFSYSTVSALKEISRLSKAKKIFSLLGGGHLSTTIQKYHIPDNFSYVSSAGGALVQYLSGKKLPGIAALESSAKRSFQSI
jgi:phosphoglycerate kinase